MGGKIKHGESLGNGYRSPEYNAWKQIKRRCFCKTFKRYPDYGGSGITMCDRWKDSYSNFLADMGRKPSPIHTIDRFPNSKGDYEPGNCRWATPTQQSRNRGDYNRIIIFNGESHCIPEWAEKMGLTGCCIWNRIKLGWSVEEMLTTPMRKNKKRNKI